MKNYHLTNLLRGILISVFIIALGASIDAQVQRYDSNLNKISRPIPKEFKEDITLNTTILLNDTHYKLEGVIISIYNKTTNSKVKARANDSFKLYLKHDCLYEISFEYPGYSTKKIDVNTYSPTTFIWVIDLIMRLYDNDKPANVGSLYYSKEVDNFVSEGPHLKPN